MRFPDTVAAIATPPGQGAVALVRVSGPEAMAVAGAAPVHERRTGETAPADAGTAGSAGPEAMDVQP